VLEDLIIDAIYADIVRGKLDQKQQQFEVQYTMGRDLRPGQLEELLGALQDWCVRIEPLLDSMPIVMLYRLGRAAFQRFSMRWMEKLLTSN
jgi:hypothetical protein